jgi:type II secretory pathway pseudopilin PulG
MMIVGIIAAIAMGNYFNAINRAKQKRTMADMRAIATAWESRAVDTRQYNAAGSFTVPSAVLAYDDVALMLMPTYCRSMSRFDGWNHPLDYRLDRAVGNSVAAASYTIRSTGRDGVLTGSSYTDGPTTNYDCDIVYSNGQFVVWPEGVQQK